MNNKEIKVPSHNMLNELAISESERKFEKERTEREKNVFAETLKSSLGKEMKEVLLEKKEIEAKPVKKNKIREFFEKLAKVCQ